MKKIAIIFLTLTGLASSVALSQSAVKGSSTIQVGIVDIQAVILNVEEGKKARAKLENQIKAQEKKLKTRKQELDKMSKEWQGKLALMSNEARMKKQKEFQVKLIKWRKNEMEFQSSIKRREQQATQKIAVRIAKLAEKIASEKKLALVFEANSSGLLYVANPVNLTKKIINQYPTFVKKLAKTASNSTKTKAKKK